MEKTHRAKAANEFPTTISEEEYIQGWRNATHNTNSNLTGPNYHVYKSTTHNETLTKFETILLNILYKTGYSPKQWQQTLDIVLRKQQNNLDVKKLQTIGLLEADFNFMCKYIGC